MPWCTVLADLHGRTPDVGHDGIRADSQVVLIAGDICPDKDQEHWYYNDFKHWCGRMPCPVIAVAGNHDKFLEKGVFRHIDNFTLLAAGEMVETPIGTVLGCPLTLNGGANFGSEQSIWEALSGKRADVLLCHNPPLGVLDKMSDRTHMGSAAIALYLAMHQPKLCVFGHIHEKRGWQKFRNVYCINATLGAGCNNTGYPVPAPHTPWGLCDESWKQ